MKPDINEIMENFHALAPMVANIKLTAEGWKTRRQIRQPLSYRPMHLPAYTRNAVVITLS